MIWLGSEYLMFQMPSGESVAFSSEAIAVEIVDETDGDLDPTMVKQAANAVYHYFKHELGRQTVTVGEFAKAMEKALDGFEISIVSNQRQRTPAPAVAESDLCQIARDSGRASCSDSMAVTSSAPSSVSQRKCWITSWSSSLSQYWWNSYGLVSAGSRNTAPRSLKAETMAREVFQGPCAADRPSVPAVVFIPEPSVARAVASRSSYTTDQSTPPCA